MLRNTSYSTNIGIFEEWPFLLWFSEETIQAKEACDPLHLEPVLPVLSQLSKIFQQGNINFAAISPCIKHTKQKLHQLDHPSSDVSQEPIRKFQDDFKAGGNLSMCGILCSDDIEYACAVFHCTGLPSKEQQNTVDRITLLYCHTISLIVLINTHKFLQNGMFSSTILLSGNCRLWLKTEKSL